MQIGYAVEGAKSKRESQEDAPTAAPMAPRGTSRTSPSTDQKKVRRRLSAVASTGSFVICNPDTGEIIDAGFSTEAEAEEFMREFYAGEDGQPWSDMAVVVPNNDEAISAAMHTAKVASDDLGPNAGGLRGLWESFKEWAVKTLAIDPDDPDARPLLGDYADPYVFGALSMNINDANDVSPQREAALLQAMASAPLADQPAYARALSALQHRRASLAQQGRDLDLGGAVIRDTLTPVLTASLHTTATDWLDPGDTPNADVVQRSMTAAASRWFSGVAEAVKVDPDEYRTQAQGMASVLAGAHAPLDAAAADAFVRHALFLNRTAYVSTAAVVWQGKQYGRTASRRTSSVDLTNISIVDRAAGTFKGTDSSGNSVTFQVSPEDAEQLASILFGDLAQNFSGVTIEDSDIISQASRTAADADVSAYDAEDSGYAMSGLPVEPPQPVGYDAPGVVDGTQDNFAPEVAPENAAAVAQEGDHVPMPGAGEQVTSAVEAGMRPADFGFAQSILHSTAARHGDESGAWKAQFAGVGELVWSGNGVTFDTQEEASDYAHDLLLRWGGADIGRVVPTSTPLREVVDLNDPQIVVNYRTASKVAKTYDTATCANCGEPIMSIGIVEPGSPSAASGATLGEHWVHASSEADLVSASAQCTGDHWGEFATPKTASKVAADGDLLTVKNNDQDPSNGGESSIDPNSTVDEKAVFSPWVLPPSGVQTGDGAANVAGVPTPGGEAGYPQPTASRRTSGYMEGVDCPGSNEFVPSTVMRGDSATCSVCGQTIPVSPASGRFFDDDGSPYTGGYLYVHLAPGKTLSDRTSSLVSNPQALAAFRTRVAQRKLAGDTCATCGDSITRDSEGEDNRTWHHTNGTSHDHEAKPSGDSEES